MLDYGTYQSILNIPEGEWEITVNMPLYSGLREPKMNGSPSIFIKLK